MFRSMRFSFEKPCPDLKVVFLAVLLAGGAAAVEAQHKQSGPWSAELIWRIIGIMISLVTQSALPLFLSLGGCLSCVRAQEKVGTTFSLHTTVAGSNFQNFPSAASLRNGSFIVTWDSFGQDDSTFPGSYGVFAQVFDEAGLKVGDEFLVNTWRPGDQISGSVAVLSSGNFVVAWQSMGQSGPFVWGIYFQLFDGAGAKIGLEGPVYADSSKHQFLPAVAGLSNGNFIVAWSSISNQDGSDSGVYAQLFNGEGGMVGSEFLVNSYTAWDQTNPSVASLERGAFVITWHGWGSNGLQIYAQLFDDAGRKSSREFQVNLNSPFTFATAFSHRSVTSLSCGNFGVTWQGRIQVANGTYVYGIYVQLFDGAGRRIGSELQVNTRTDLPLHSPSITSLSNRGDFIIAWISEFPDPFFPGYIFNGQVLGQQFDGSGTKIGTQFQVTNNTAVDHDYPSVARSRSGGFLVTWGRSGPDAGVYGQIYSNASTAMTGNTTIICTAPTTRTSFIADTYYSASTANNDETLLIVGAVTNALLLVFVCGSLCLIRRRVRLRHRASSSSLSTSMEAHYTSSVRSRTSEGSDASSDGMESSADIIPPTVHDGQLDFLEDVIRGQVIGSGAFGDVYAGTWCGTDVALKCIRDAGDDSLAAAEFWAEVGTLQSLKHPNVVQYLGIFKAEAGSSVLKRYYMVVEYVSGGSLLTALRTGSHSVLECLRFCLDTSKGLAYIASKGILHRDVAARNLLLTNSNLVKVSDMGMSRISPDDYYKSTNHRLPVRWSSVEVLVHGRFTSAADVWAFGVTMWEIFTRGIEPYLGLGNLDVKQCVIDGKMHSELSKPPRAPGSAYALMLSCWQMDSSKRPSFETLVEQLKALYAQEMGPGNLTDANKAQPIPSTSSAGCGMYVSEDVSSDSDARDDDVHIKLSQTGPIFAASRGSYISEDTSAV